MKKLRWEDDMKTLPTAFLVSVGLLISAHSFAFIYDTHPEQCRAITGMTREQFLKEPHRIFFEELTGCVLITNAREQWIAGSFKMHTVDELSKAVELRSKDAAANSGQLNVAYAYDNAGLSPLLRKKMDIAALQADPHNAGAIFQVFTGTDCKCRVADGYSSLNAAVSATPGAIIRHHYLPEIDLALPVECFEECRRSHGYVSLIGMHRATLQRINRELDYTSMGIGIHLDTNVAFDMSGRAIKADHGITQIFTTRIEFAANTQDKAALSIAQKVILAAYEGTMHAAAKYGEQTIFSTPRPLQQVFITLPNDGKNLTHHEFAWIQEALEACIPLIEKYGLDVTLVMPDLEENAHTHEFLTAMQELVEITGGVFKKITPSTPPSSPKRKGRRQ